MAITPPSDIVLDVAQAADPERYRQAVEHLTRLRATAAANAAAATSNGAGPGSAGNVSTAAGSGSGSGSGSGASAAGPGRRRLDAFGQFEAFILQSFLQSMLPTGARAVYGKGTAGEVWRSMLAEQLGNQLAGSGQVGIARHLASSVAAQQAIAAGGAGARPPGAASLDLTVLSAVPPRTGQGR